MSFGSADLGDTSYEDTDSTVDSDDFDVDADYDVDYDDVSWDESSDMVDCDVDDFFTDDTTVNDISPGYEQLSLFETDEQATDTTDVEVDSAVLEETDTSDEQPEVITGQVDFDEYFDYLEDLHHTPTYNSPLGEWDGTRGDSLFIPSDAEAQRILGELGLEGIPYKEGRPDFSDVTAATAFLTQEDMETLSDEQQKEMANLTLADDISDEPDDTAEDNSVESSNMALAESVLNEDVDEYYAALLSGEVPQGFVWHHGDVDADGDYPYMLIPEAIHKSCLHRGGRSHTQTKR